MMTMTICPYDVHDACEHILSLCSLPKECLLSYPKTMNTSKRKHKDGDEEGTDNSDSSSRKRKKMAEKETISVDTPACKICEAFFVCMDFDGNGFIEEMESKILSVIAFDKSESEAEVHWKSMLESMDIDKDKRISKEEYISWWTERHANEYLKENGSFIEDYAKYLLESLKKISSVKVANKMCDTFFESIDTNKDGFLVESEVKNVSKWAFGQSPNQADATWKDMLRKMDTNNDNKISKEEYRSYWLNKAKTKIQPDGTFVDGYKRYLLKKLMKVKNGNIRQEQLRKWKPCSDLEEASPRSNKIVAFHEDNS